MSAYIVEDDTIDLLASAMQYWSGLRDGQYRQEEADHAVQYLRPAIRSWEGVARAMLDANVESVTARYTQIDDEEWNAAEVYTFRPVNVAAWPPALLLATVAHSLACWEYQACEGDDYEARPGWRYVQVLKTLLMQQVPGCSATPWGWTRGGGADGR